MGVRLRFRVDFWSKVGLYNRGWQEEMKRERVKGRGGKMQIKREREERERGRKESGGRESGEKERGSREEESREKERGSKEKRKKAERKIGEREKAKGGQGWERGEGER